MEREFLESIVDGGGGGLLALVEGHAEPGGARRGIGGGQHGNAQDRNDARRQVEPEGADAAPLQPARQLASPAVEDGFARAHLNALH